MPCTPLSVRHRSGGFSAIELMTTLVLVGILASLATPALNEYVDRTRTRRALDRVVSDVSYARMLAVQRGAPAAILLREGGVYTVESRNTDGTWEIVRTVPLREEFGDVTFTGAPAMLEFNSRGLVTNLGTDSYIKIARAGARDSIFVSPAGRVYRDF